MNLTYGEKKSIISECLNTGKISSKTKYNIWRQCLDRAKRNKTKLSYEGSNSAGKSLNSSKSKSIGEVPRLSKPNYLQNSVSNRPFKMPFSKFYNTIDSTTKTLLVLSTDLFT